MDIMQKQSERILFFDLGISGHHVEYLYHLIQYRVEHPECPEFVLLTHPGFLERVSALNLPNHWRESGINVIHPSPEEMRKLEAKQSIFSRADREFRILYKNAEKYKIKYCHLMVVDQFQYILGTNYARNFPCLIRGILFTPYAAMDNGGYFAEKCAVQLFKFRKHLQNLWMLRNRKIDRIYVLDNSDCVQYFNGRYHKKNLFVTLADPILIPPGFDRQIIDTKRKSSRYRFLLFGTLSSRKGIFHVIDALRCIPETVEEKIEVIFAGKLIDEESNRFRSAIADLQRERPKIKVTLHDEFIPYEKIPGLFLESDCVLLPYTITHGSSGVIGHSALYGKPIISSASGIIGKQIRNYRLGIGIKPVNGTNIAAAMMDAVKNGSLHTDNIGMQRYLKDHSPKKFVETLLE